jgi:hypothetical protein
MSSMSVALTSLEPVRSANQRALASQWNRLSAGRLFPAFTEFKPEPDKYDPRQLVVWSIEGEGRQLKFRALYQGENVAEVFNSAWTGKTMEQVVPMSLRRVTLEAAKECVRSRCLIYTIVSTIDSNERRVDCERLLLPFGRDGSRVEQILAFLQLKSVEGQVRRRKILNNFELQADLVSSFKIKSGFAEIGSAPTTQISDAHATASEVAVKPKRRPRASRRDIRRAGRISFADGSFTCTVRNISATGALIEGTKVIKIPKTFSLILEMESAERSCTVVWRKGTQIGVRFG